jgi:hypothetical protein
MPAPAVLDEVVLVGPHPDLVGVEVVVVGSLGTDETWRAACELASVALSSAASRGIKDPGVVVVDWKRDMVRPAKSLRRMR